MLSSLLAPLLAFSVSGVPSVIIVDASGAGDHLTINGAIAAAVDGDTIFIRPGSYTRFLVDNKELDLVADTSGLVTIRGYCRVRNLDQQKEVLLSGLQLTTPSGQYVFPAAFEVLNCSGPVRISYCSITGRNHDDGPGGPAVLVGSCADVAFFDCTIEGGDGGLFSSFCGWPGGAGLTVVDSTVALHGTVVVGGLSGDLLISSIDSGGNGGDACLVNAQSVFRAFSCTFLGGDGGNADVGYWGCSCGDGGAGLLVSPGAVVEVHACTFTGGLEGYDHFASDPCVDGADRAGPITDLVGPNHRLEAARYVHATDNLTGTIIGQPGELVFLMVATRPAHTPYPVLAGVLHLGSPYMERGLPIGQIDANGLLQLQWPVGPLSTGVLAEHIYVQAIISGPAGRWFSNAAAVVLLDPSL